jgi:hypothetical protein
VRSCFVSSRSSIPSTRLVYTRSVGNISSGEPHRSAKILMGKWQEGSAAGMRSSATSSSVRLRMSSCDSVSGTLEQFLSKLSMRCRISKKFETNANDGKCE